MPDQLTDRARKAATNMVVDAILQECCDGCETGIENCERPCDKVQGVIDIMKKRALGVMKSKEAAPCPM